jgi:hypothetical protein
MATHSPSLDQVGIMTSPNQLGTLNIVCTCLFTILTCTWTVVHLNIAFLRAPRWQMFVDRAIGLILTALAPEVMLGLAIIELLDVRLAVKVLRNLQRKVNEDQTVENGCAESGGVTAFHVMMGGLQVRFRQASGRGPRPTEILL